MSVTTRARRSRTPEPRVERSLSVALAVIVAYAVVFTVVAVTSGIPCTAWFASGPSAFRATVLPLAVGAVLVVAFLWWARWDFVFRDPERLPMRRAYWIAAAVFALGFVVHLLVVRWGQITPSLVAAVLAAGVLVVPAAGVAVAVVALLRDRETVVGSPGHAGPSR